MHASRLARMRVHGSCNILEPELTRLEMATSKNGFGFGFCDGEDGELTHHFWSLSSGDVEHGP